MQTDILVEIGHLSLNNAITSVAVIAKKNEIKDTV